MEAAQPLFDRAREGKRDVFAPGWRDHLHADRQAAATGSGTHHRARPAQQVERQYITPVGETIVARRAMPACQRMRRRAENRIEVAKKSQRLRARGVDGFEQLGIQCRFAVPARTVEVRFQVGARALGTVTFEKAPNQATNAGLMADVSLAGSKYNKITPDAE